MRRTNPEYLQVGASFRVRQFGNSIEKLVGTPLEPITAAGGGKPQLFTASLAKPETTNLCGLVGCTVPRGKHSSIWDRLLFSRPSSIMVGEYCILELGSRMLVLEDLFSVQGLDENYVFHSVLTSRLIAQTSHMKLCSNSVSPKVAE